MTFGELCRDSELTEAVLMSIVETGLDNSLHRRELPVRICLCSDEWTPDNGLLTAALKLKRPVIANKYKLSLDIMFNRV